jgi:signal recognition particle GTPase
MGNMIDTTQLKQVEIRIKRSEALICSMTKKERANPDSLLMDKSSRSQNYQGIRVELEDGVAFMSEFQKMRTMISPMSKQAGMGGSEGLEAEEMDPAIALAGGGARGESQCEERRAQKKKGGGGGGMGFGAR